MGVLSECEQVDAALSGASIAERRFLASRNCPVCRLGVQCVKNSALSSDFPERPRGPGQDGARVRVGVASMLPVRPNCYPNG